MTYRCEAPKRSCGGALFNTVVSIGLVAVFAGMFVLVASQVALWYALKEYKDEAKE